MMCLCNPTCKLRGEHPKIEELTEMPLKIGISSVIVGILLSTDQLLFYPKQSFRAQTTFNNKTSTVSKLLEDDLTFSQPRYRPTST
jgi:hypothetical protein